MPPTLDSTATPQHTKAPQTADDVSEATKDSTPSPAPSSAQTPTTGDRPFNVYVKNFTAAVDDAQLQTMFKACGTIQSCTVLHDHLGKSKQVGFVQFSSDDEAKKAVQEMHNKTGYGVKPLHVALTNKKPVNNRRRTDMAWRSYEHTPMRQPMYGSYSMSSSGSPPTPPHTPMGTPPHMYPSSVPTWGSSGAVHMVYVPYDPYSYGKPAQRTPHYRSAPKGATQHPASPLTPSGLYTGPQPYYEPYHYGHYMPPYDPYQSSYSAYAGYNAGWGTPYYHYTQSAAPHVNYAYAQA